MFPKVKEEILIIKLKHKENYYLDIKQLKENISSFLNSTDLSYQIEFRNKVQSKTNVAAIVVVDMFSSRIQKSLDFIFKNFSSQITLKQASEEVCLSKYYFEKIFTDEIGIPFKKFLNIYRLLKATEILRSKYYLSVTDVCFDVGFTDLSNFIHQFKKTIGCPPKKFSNCNIDIKKCLLWKKSSFYHLNKDNNKLNNALNIKIYSPCIMNRAKKASVQSCSQF